MAAFKPNHRFLLAILGTPFKIFEPLADLGYYGWKPNGMYKGLHCVSAMEMMESIDYHMLPDKVVPEEELNRILPMKFAASSPQIIRNRYPYGQFYLASLHVALKHRGLAERSIKFFFGGSTLHMLASTQIPNDAECYLVTKIPGTDIIMVAREKDYVCNYSDFGFQFERLATGKAFDDRHSIDRVSHLQLINVAGYGVLFSAESDAIDSKGTPVEIKASNPSYWGTKTMFQMISSGSTNLYFGIKDAGTLLGVRVDSLTSTMATALADFDVCVLEKNIRNGMDTLQREAQAGLFDDGDVFAITFQGTNLKLIPFTGPSTLILPSKKVIFEMLS